MTFVICPLSGSQRSGDTKEEAEPPARPTQRGARSVVGLRTDVRSGSRAGTGMGTGVRTRQNGTSNRQKSQRRRKGRRQKENVQADSGYAVSDISGVNIYRAGVTGLVSQ